LAFVKIALVAAGQGRSVERNAQARTGGQGDEAPFVAMRPAVNHVVAHRSTSAHSPRPMTPSEVSSSITVSDAMVP
jgi:hypothetical protein